MSRKMMLTNCLWLVFVVSVTSATQVWINDRAIHQVSSRFLSFTVDDNVFYPSVRWGAFNFSSPRVPTLLSGLSPAIWRIGGSPADWLIFNSRQDKQNMSAAHSKTPIIMSKSDWDKLVTMSMKTNLRLLFDLDLQLRIGTHWDLSNAIELFDYCVSRGYGSNLDWELGNEPNVYRAPDQLYLTPDEIGSDFVSLAKLVRSYPQFSNSSVVGPDIVGVDRKSAPIIRSYLEKAGGYVNAVTLHQYYFRGDTAQWKEYINLHHFESLANYLKAAKNIIQNSSYPQMSLWLGETNDAWHSGTANVSDRYISGFLWLDKLGVSAQHGVDVVIRQTFWGHDYGMVNNSMLPNPDYWLSLLYRRLVGTSVLDVHTDRSLNTTRVYAHCASTRYYRPGAVTMFMLNVATNVTDTIRILNKFLDGKMDVYLMTPFGDQGLLSQEVALNGKVLRMVNDHTLPELKPFHTKIASGFNLPPTTYAFLVFPNAKMTSCM